MSLPTPVKTWNHNANNRITFVSNTQCMQDAIVAFKNELKTRGFTVKGSCDGTTGAMDGVDRLGGFTVRGASPTAPQSWIVLEHTGMGGVEILIAYQGAATTNMKLALSQSGVWTLAATATHQPTATDEQIVMPNTGNLDGAATSGDRLWSTAISSDGSQVHLIIARAGVWVNWLYIGLADPSAVISPAAWSPAVVSFRRAASQMNLADLVTTTANMSGRVNPSGGYVAATFFGGTEGFNGSNGVAAIGNVNPPAQGGTGFLFFPISLWSLTSTVEGKWGNLIDIWAGLTTVNDGDTYPNDTSRQFICLGDFIIKWNGSAPVLT